MKGNATKTPKEHDSTYFSDTITVEPAHYVYLVFTQNGWIILDSINFYRAIIYKSCQPTIAFRVHFPLESMIYNRIGKIPISYPAIEFNVLMLVIHLCMKMSQMVQKIWILQWFSLSSSEKYQSCISNYAGHLPVRKSHSTQTSFTLQNDDNTIRQHWPQLIINTLSVTEDQSIYQL